MRTLIVIPIIHAEQDMGSLLEQVREGYVQRYGQAKWDEHLKTVHEVWTGIRRMIEALDLPYASVRLYQDGLPDCGREADIVKEVAAQGSKNHQLLLELMEKGARLMGTEDPHLLLQEYQLLRGALATGCPRPPLTPALSPPGGRGEGEGESEAVSSEEQSRRLLAERDRYIAKRINATLEPGEIGLLFLGLAHSVEPFLDADIFVRNLLPALRPPETGAGHT